MRRVGVPTVMLQSCGGTRNDDHEMADNNNWAAGPQVENMDGEEEGLYSSGERGGNDVQQAEEEDMVDSILRNCMRGGGNAEEEGKAEAFIEGVHDMDDDDIMSGRDPAEQQLMQAEDELKTMRDYSYYDYDYDYYEEEMGMHMGDDGHAQLQAAAKWRNCEEEEDLELIGGCGDRVLEPEPRRYAGPTLTDIESALMAMDRDHHHLHPINNTAHPSSSQRYQYHHPPFPALLVDDVWGRGGTHSHPSWPDIGTTVTGTDPSGAAAAAPPTSSTDPHHQKLMPQRHHPHLRMNNNNNNNHLIIHTNNTSSSTCPLPFTSSPITVPSNIVPINNSSTSTANVTTQAIQYYRKPGKIDPCWDSSNWRLKLLKRNNLEPKYTVKVGTEAEAIGDGYKWRKYGQKNIKNCSFPRSYYKCSAANCNAKKQIERKHEDPQLFLVTYEGLHIHLRPHPQRKMHGL